jgi:hypothetical protein
MVITVPYHCYLIIIVIFLSTGLTDCTVHEPESDVCPEAHHITASFEIKLSATLSIFPRMCAVPTLAVICAGVFTRGLLLLIVLLVLIVKVKLSLCLTN